MRRIAQDIKDKNFCKTYLLGGDEAYLRHQYRDKLMDVLVAEGDTMNVSRYEGKGISIPEVIDIAQTMPFLAERRVILIEDSGLFGAGAADDGLADYVKQLPESTCMIFVEENVDKRSKLYKAVKSEGYAADFVRQTEEDLKKWVAAKLRRENLGITNQALEDFISGTGNDMMLINSELEKLISYCLGKEGITSEDVSAICIPRVEDKIFLMLEHMLSGRCEMALSLYGDLLALREAPAKILFMIERQLKLMLHVKMLREEGKSQNEMASILSANPYAVKKIIPQAERISKKSLTFALKLCADTEEDTKTGKIDPQIGVELIIVTLAKGKVV